MIAEIPLSGGIFVFERFCELKCINRPQNGKTYCAAFFSESIDNFGQLVYNIKAVAKSVDIKVTEVKKVKKI